ncbi:sensor histidine kinase inhibitor, KipI family [Alteribacillus persepolensis]|uniref:Sensor histidine kinase inhibitor, KipI family n=1 Tax=Alteribacillus persepolensis TaxID=568899 RepID=A0A1G8J5S0_9BACI|nr:5-oxoprolinase subunit PxpB [Alteribacillus persepolensis]SDI26628.1 sensor histidine kinase inhibitor, KipI family [Alteribacillus persepolensis]
MSRIYIEAMGDSAFSVVFGHFISKKVNQHIRTFLAVLDAKQLYGVSEWVPSYTSVTVYYDPARVSYTALKKELEQCIGEMQDAVLPHAKVYEIPVGYGGEYGPDLEKVAEHNQLQPEQVIERHTANPYLIYMLGFTPGFPYLGGMNESLSTPRLKTPRSLVKAGSVGIAGAQTGIYSLDSPGGWNIIGRSPVKLLDMKHTQPVLLAAGHYIRFISVSAKTYQSIEQQVCDGTYEVKVDEVKEEDYDA